MDRLAGGSLRLDRARSRRALAGIARRLGAASIEAAAEGAVEVAEAHMAAALRRVSVERGHDPRDAALVAYGGAGGLHACALAEALEVRSVVFPRHAGLLCAIGALAGGSRRERSRSVLLDAGDGVGLAARCRELEQAVRQEFAARDRARVRIERWAEVRYRGQSHELSLRLGAGLDRAFHREHRRRFGFADPSRAVEVVTLEVRGHLAAEPLPGVGEWFGAIGNSTAGARSMSRARVAHRGRSLDAAIWERAALAQGFAARGPVIVLEEGASLWVPPGWTARLHASGAMVVTR